MKDQVHRLHLELRLDGAAPTGQVCPDGGAPRAFSGWVGLVRVVDELVGGEPGPISAPAPAPAVTVSSSTA
jgi:hypothetical protein